MLGGCDDFLLGVGDGQIAAPFYSLDCYVAMLRDSIVTDIFTSCRIKEFPDFTHHGMMYSCIDIIDQENSIPALDHEESQTKHTPDPVAHTPDRDAIVDVL